MEELPWADGSFDVVTGFNSFFVAADMVNALAEARRVARPGASVFGRPDRCRFDSDVPGCRPASAGAARYRHPEGGCGPTREGALETLATEAGLRPAEAGYIEFVENYRVSR